MRDFAGRWRVFPILLTLCTALLVGCPTTTSDDFESISEHGFDAADNAEDLNDYPWGMQYFVPDGADRGRLYVATGNNIAMLALAVVGKDVSSVPFHRPPEIRRYRPDLGSKVWERVLDYRDVESGPEWETSGFRGMATYRAQADGVAYLYAGTIGLEPAVWRSRSGEPGTWERVWSHPVEGSIRAMAAHNGLLYVGLSHDQLSPALPGEIYVTDGETFELVVGDGFGKTENAGIYSMASYNGWLYAGTTNSSQGFEVWKLAGPGDGGEIVQVVAGGGPSRSNQSASQMLVFQDRLYVGGLIYGGINLYGFPLRGADMIRIDADDNVETVVGPGSLGGIGSGFDDATNPYIWSLAEHDGMLYCGTWDSSAIVPVAMRYLPQIIAVLSTHFKQRPDAYDIVTGSGGELYVSPDGVRWDPVFTDGLGNPDNYGVRSMVSAEGTLYLGMANLFEGLEIWRMRGPEGQ